MGCFAMKSEATHFFVNDGVNTTSGKYNLHFSHISVILMCYQLNSATRPDQP